MIDRDAIRLRWEADGSKRDERGRRLWAASEVRAAGWGGLAAVSDITGLARSTIERGLKDIDTAPLGRGRVRREGGDTRRKNERDATLLDDLKHLVEPDTLGDPVRPLLWVSKSLEKLSSALADMGHSVSPNTVRMLLATKLGFSRQSNRKADEGTNHPDRNAQFEYINAQVLAARAVGEPVISVDTKRKELVGNYRNAGSGSRVRLWKVELQKLADDTNLTIKVRHYPPGTSKWNKIEHRLFCHITQNWRGRPLTDHATIIDLIASTSTKTGLKVEAVLDTTVYEKGIKIANAEMKRLNIRGDAFHPEWNYIIIPRPKS